MIKGVYFDLDGIYFNRGIDAFIKNFSSTYALNEFLLKSLIKTSKEAKDCKMGTLSLKEFFEFVSRGLGKNIPSNEFLEELTAGYELNHNSKELCLKLREKGYKTLICNNNFKELIELLEFKFSFLKDFDVKVFSFDFHVLKPDQKMFEILLSESGLSPSEILYVEDDRLSFEQTKKMGFESYPGGEFEVLEEAVKRFDLLK